MIVNIDLPDISAEFTSGQMIGVVGPDGSGKTTLMRLLATLLIPRSGTITIKGFDTVKDAEDIRSFMGYMPQRFGLYEDLTVMQNLSLYAELRGAKRDFDRLLSFTGLAPFTKRLAGNLSGGMKQKLGLACALIKTPELLLLDEPSVGVDPISRKELWKMTKELLDQGITVFWSTAYLDEAERCEQVLLLDQGKLLYKGTPEKLEERVKGRVCKMEGGREKLLKVVLEENTVDAVLEGSGIRMVVKKPIPGMVLEVPRFEDAFMDLLGGGPKEKSKLAARAPLVEGGPSHVIEVKNLTKKFGAFTAVNDISFQVKKGEVFGLLGPNGAGKSTTFKMLCGLVTPTSGSATVDGIDIKAARGQIGYMAQKFSLYGNLTVYQNLQFFAGIYRAKGIEEMIEIFELKPFITVDL
jgi:ABC-2 type transport system ATP-binding protein